MWTWRVQITNSQTPAILLDSRSKTTELVWNWREKHFRGTASYPENLCSRLAKIEKLVYSQKQGAVLDMEMFSNLEHGKGVEIDTVNGGHRLKKIMLKAIL